MTTERAKVNHLLERGAQIAVDSDKITDFEALGHRVAFEAGEALERATVVIDCTPAGNENKKVYEKLSGPRGFLAQEVFGFGKMFVRHQRRGIVWQTVSCRSSPATRTTSPPHQDARHRRLARVS
jgi:hypothetical protein